MNTLHNKKLYCDGLNKETKSTLNHEKLTGCKSEEPPLCYDVTVDTGTSPTKKINQSVEQMVCFV